MDCSSCIFIILILIIVSGVLSIVETGLSKFKAYYDENELQSKGFLTNLALEISQNFRDFSSTFLISNILIFTTIGWILSISFLDIVQLLIIQIGLQINEFITYTILIAFLLFFVAPFAVFVTGRLSGYLPSKTLATSSVKLVLPILFLHYLFFPIRIVLQVLERVIELLFKHAVNSSHLNSEEELRILIEESTKAGNIEENESKLIDNIFEFKDTIVRQVMTPRKNIVAIGDDWNNHEVLETVVAEGYSRYPVYSNNADNIRGILHTKDLVSLVINNKLIVLKDIIRPTLFVKEDDFIDDLLSEFQKKKVQMAIVLDDFGGTSGIITMEDILEEIVGEIHDEHDEVNRILDRISEFEFLADASAQIRDLNELLPEELLESDEYESLGGLITTETENIPELNAEIKIGNYTFIILKRSKTRIERVRIIYNKIGDLYE